MTGVRNRAARPADVPDMVEVYSASRRDMQARLGVSTPPPSRAALRLAYGHVLSTGMFRVAEAQGRIVAIAGAVLRDSLWFLSAFWTRPDVQRQNIGMPLLREVWDAGVRAGASTFFTWASPDLTALAAYMKLGMLPGYGIFLFEGAPDQLPPVPAGYEAAPLEPRELAEIDLHVRGIRREADHHFWAGPAGLRGRQVLREGAVVGYYYVDGGAVGPAAWSNAAEAGAVMALAARDLDRAGARVRFVVPGINQAALRVACASGLRLVAVNHFLTTAPFGHLERYLPSGPLLY